MWPLLSDRNRMFETYYLSANLYTKNWQIFTLKNMHIRCFFHICCLTWHTFYLFQLTLGFTGMLIQRKRKSRVYKVNFTKIVKYPVYYVCFEVSRILVKLNSAQYCTCLMSSWNPNNHKNRGQSVRDTQGRK